MSALRQYCLWVFICASIGVGNCYELATHAKTSNSAFLQSRLAADVSLIYSLGLAVWTLPLSADTPFSTASGDIYFDVTGSSIYTRLATSYEADVLFNADPLLFSDRLRVKGWLLRGAIREDDGAPLVALLKGEPNDDPYVNMNRFCNHFLDPAVLHPTGRGLTGTCPFVDAPPKDAAQWALGSDSPFDATPPELQGRRNHFTILDAREAMWRALTLRDRSGNPLSQTANGTTFSWEDMRRAYWATTFRALGDVVHLVQDMAQPQHTRNEGHGVGNKGYEEYINARASNATTYTIDDQTLNAAAGQLPDLVYSGYPIPAFNRYSDYWSTVVTTGLVWGMADYSNRGFFTLESNIGNALYPKPSPSLSAYTLVRTGSGFLGLDSNYLFGTVDDDVLVSTDGATMSTQSVFQGPGTTVYTLSKRNYDDRAALLIPRAAAYSGGLINYFFRGQMAITPRDDGVYAFVDHSRFSGDGAASTDPNGFKGFSKIRLNLKNTTADIRDPGGNVYPQAMGSGSVVAVVKFHRNTCYADDLSVQGTFLTCRAPAEEIVVSQPVPVDSIPAVDPPRPLEFTFDKEIPINIMDAYLQVVFRGQLGQESDAVVVATNDISEPTYVAMSNSNDYIWINGDVHTRDEVANSSTLLSLVQPRSCVDSNNHLVSSCLVAQPLDMSLAVQLPSGGTQFQALALPVGRYTRVAYLTDAGASPTYAISGCISGGSTALPPLQQELIVNPDGSMIQRFDTMSTSRGAHGWVQLDCVLMGDGTSPQNRVLGMGDLSNLHPVAVNSTTPTW